MVSGFGMKRGRALAQLEVRAEAAPESGTGGKFSGPEGPEGKGRAFTFSSLPLECRENPQAPPSPL